MYKLIGKRLDGRYEFLELIGVGGMADVYRVYDNVKGCDVAIKVLKQEFSRNREFVRRFKNESKANANLSHPNIVRIFDVDFGDKIQYIVMEYIDGVTLKEFIEKAKVLDWKDVVHFTFQILRALQHAHDKGIVHRDMKPQNIMLLEDGTIKIMDFGIARFARDEKVSYGGKAIGSVHYISPEQASGGITDAKSDLYSVGIMMYEMLTGRLPFEGKTPELVAVKQIQSRARSPLEINPRIPQGLVDIITRAMQKSPEKRYQSATEMLSDIDEFKKNPDILFEYKYLNDDANTQYFTLSEKETMKNIPQGSPFKSSFKNRRDLSESSISKKKDKFIPVLLGIAAGVFLVALIIIGVFVFGRGSVPSSEEIEMPDLVGMQYEDIKKISNGRYADLRFVVSSEDNPKYKTGVICSQSPSPGIKIKRNGEVQISVSNGEKLKQIPDVCGLNYKVAQTQLNREGFRNLKLVKKASDSVMEDDVISTDPEVGAQVALNCEIKIYYSSGISSDKMVIVPNVVGKSVDDARNELQKLGFDVSIVKTTDGDCQENCVVSQNKTGKLKSGSTIEIVVKVKSDKSEKNEKPALGFSKNEEKRASFPYKFRLVSDRPISDTFNVVVTNANTGKVISEGKYRVNGTVELNVKCKVNSDPIIYDVNVTNSTTGKTAKYGKIIFDCSRVNSNNELEPRVKPVLNPRAFANTLDSKKEEQQQLTSTPAAPVNDKPSTSSNSLEEFNLPI